jgi:hypothetical protein
VDTLRRYLKECRWLIKIVSELVELLSLTVQEGVHFSGINLSLLVATFVQSIYSYIPETNDVSRVYSVAAVLWLRCTVCTRTCNVICYVECFVLLH